MVKGHLTGCGLHGWLSSILSYQQVNLICRLFLNKKFLFLFLVLLFVYFVVSVYRISLTVEDYTKCKLSSRGSPMLLEIFFQLVFVAVCYMYLYTTHANTCYVLLLYPCHHVAHYKIIISCFYCRLNPCRVSYSLPPLDMVTVDHEW